MTICPRCAKQSADIHICTPTEYVRGMEAENAALKRDHTRDHTLVSELYISTTEQLHFLEQEIPALKQRIAELEHQQVSDGELHLADESTIYQLTAKLDQAEETSLCSGPSGMNRAEIAWLVEDGSGLRWRYMDQGVPLWTTDPNQAMRFARRQDAEMFAAEDEDAWRITEHMWVSPPFPSPPASKEP